MVGQGGVARRAVRQQGLDAPQRVVPVRGQQGPLMQAALDAGENGFGRDLQPDDRADLFEQRGVLRPQRRPAAGGEDEAVGT